MEGEPTICHNKPRVINLWIGVRSSWANMSIERQEQHITYHTKIEPDGVEVERKLTGVNVRGCARQKFVKDGLTLIKVVSDCHWRMRTYLIHTVVQKTEKFLRYRDVVHPSRPLSPCKRLSI
jgi:hypothetical protein